MNCIIRLTGISSFGRLLKQAALARDDTLAQGDAQAAEMAVGAHAHDGVAQKAERVGAADEDGAHGFAHQVVDGVF